MKKHLVCTLLLAFLLSICSGFAQNTSIKLIDPQRSWMSSKAVMDSLTVVIQPNGGYTQISYLINISTSGTIFDKKSDTVEIESFFTLPEEAIVVDSWLWVEDTLVYADLIDRWTASQIYENIVKRVRRDPSLFLKNSPTAYEFRLFPLVGTTHRKFLISFMIPNRIENDKFKFEIPKIWFTQTTMPNNMKIVFINRNDVNNLYVSNDMDLPMNDDNDMFFGHYKSAVIPMQNFLSYNTYGYKSNFKDGISITNYNVAGEKYYHMIMDLNTLTPNRKALKHLVLFEYVNGKSKISFENTIQPFLDALDITYSAGDSINIMYCDMISDVKLLFPDFIEVNPESIGKLKSEFQKVQSKISRSAFLPLLLNNAVSLLQTTDTTGSVVVFSNNDELGSLDIANTFIKLIMDKSKGKIPFYFLDHGSTSNKKYSINSVNYIGNEYLYINLSRATKGEYYNIWSNANSIGNLFSIFFNGVNTSYKDLNYYILTSDGFVYQTFEPYKSILSSKGMLSSLGKYVGGPDFIIRLTFMLDDKPHIKEVKITDDVIIKSNALPQIWVGNHLKYLEAIAKPNNSTVQDIIKISMDNRVLSLYTAFLALEPWMREILLGGDDPDDPGLSDIDDEIEILNSELGISAHPNPAMINTNLIFNSPLETNITSIDIYDLNGSVIRKLNVPTHSIKGEYIIFWDLLDDFGRPVPEGAYFVIVNVGLKSFSHKIIVVK
ncbi:MAG: T9SS type A sorting domain-containing protein [Desulfobulbaceae bacterium]|nr:T9SS type A sorting domain-containing protein [Candidatus Kapabacteria bacterium]MBS3999864.1 T9SS type A sorting domain-containing protein [Desulfobulbaceae bacterium]